MRTVDILLDGFGRAAEGVPAVLDGLDDDQLARRPGPRANPIGWLVWHLARVEDEQMAELATTLTGVDHPTVWAQGWRERFDLPYPPDAHGYGMSDEDVDRWHGSAAPLAEYYAAVHAATVDILRRLDAAGLDEQLDRVVDHGYQPPVTAGVRIVSVLDDVTQHHGQAAYARGLLGA